ncbi:hypothetical protein KY284_010146 [Solanum tuberosum]|nr:hypothetical protein KY284_010146 [Solanum tuberosum]
MGCGRREDVEMGSWLEVEMGFELLLPLPSIPSSLQRRVSGLGGSFPARTWGRHLGIGGGAGVA